MQTSANHDDGQLLARFSRRFRLPGLRPDLPSVERLARAFATLPYENLTKILASADGRARAARRDASRVLEEHIRFGTGGTCFSLTNLLTRLLSAMGVEANPILADRRYGPDTHCAVRVRVHGRDYLLDPGYLLTRPVPLEAIGTEPVRVETSFNDQLLVPRSDRRAELHTVRNSSRVHRLTFKLDPVDEDAFVRAWNRSFAFDMMRYPVVTRVGRDGQRYLQGTHLRVLERNRSARREIDPSLLAEHISREFGIDATIVRRALEVLSRRERTLAGRR